MSNKDKQNKVKYKINKKVKLNILFGFENIKIFALLSFSFEDFFYFIFIFERLTLAI